MALVFIKFHSNPWINPVVPRGNSSSFRQFCRIRPTRWPRKFDLRQISESQTGSVVAFFGNRRKIRDATKARESSQEGFACSPRGEWDSVGTFGNGLGNRYTRLARLPSLSRPLSSGPDFGSSLSSSLILPSRRAPFPLFSRLLSRTESSLEKIPVNLSNLLSSGLSSWIFPSSLSRIESRLRSLRLRLKGPLLRAAIRYLLCMLFLPWSHPAVSLFELMDARELAYVVIIL